MGSLPLAVSSLLKMIDRRENGVLSALHTCGTRGVLTSER